MHDDEINVGDFSADSDELGLRELEDVVQSPHKNRGSLLHSSSSQSCAYTPIMHNFHYSNTGVFINNLSEASSIPCF